MISAMNTTPTPPSSASTSSSRGAGTPHRSSLRSGVAALAAVGLTVGLAACGSDDNDADEADEPTGPVEVTAIDYSYVDLPDEVPAGTEFTLVNDSDKEVHEFVALLLPEDEERSVEELVQLPPEEFQASFLPTVQTVLVAPPGSPGMVVEGDGVLTEPGRYAIICVIPTGADPDEFMAAAAESEGPPDVAGGPPHIVEGMFAELTVTG